MSHLDWVPTLMAAAGNSEIKQQLLAGHRAGAKSFKVHLDGYNFLPHLTDSGQAGPRREFLYFTDDGLLACVRSGDWKVVFAEQRAKRFDLWREPFVVLRIPKVFNLRRDPFERADTDSNAYNEWWTRKGPTAMGLGMIEVGAFLQTLQAYPPRQRPASFTIDRMLEAYLPQQ